MKAILLLAAVTSLCTISRAATILSDGSGLDVVTFPESIAGTSFTDSAGNVVTVGTSFFVSGGAWFGGGDITAVFTSPVTAVGFTFLNLCASCTPPVIPDFILFESITLDNGDTYNIPVGIDAGSGVPGTQFLGISSATPFTSATFDASPFSSFAISDFRFGNVQIVPEPAAFDLIIPGLLVVAGALKLRTVRRP